LKLIVISAKRKFSQITLRLHRSNLVDIFTKSLRSLECDYL